MGRANIYGHLDSYCCPAAFYRLKNLRRGDHVFVAYHNGQALDFQVQWSNVYWNNKLPTSFMFARTAERGVVLMTCSGVYHRDGTGYDRKLIVYATLVQRRR